VYRWKKKLISATVLFGVIGGHVLRGTSSQAS